MEKDTKEMSVEFVEGSGDVFADLGITLTPEEELKNCIAKEIHKTITKKKWTQVQAAQYIGVDQSKISAIVRGKLSDFSIERLLGFLLTLGKDIDIKISRRTREERGQIRVTG